ncbi:MAG: DUF2142 domain-containing protein [Anaerolineae bacterium]|nr:DUF2142 domain-containing protein [Anaerolineae bacterium]
MLRAILIMYGLLALLYLWATPIYEAPDELYHYALIHHLADTGQLPIQRPGQYQHWKQEGSQPPLYYLSAALLIAPIDRSDYETTLQWNPHAVIGDPSIPGNKNRILHTFPPPLTQTHLAVYGVRLYSVALGAITVFAVYRIGRLLAPDQPIIAIGAAAITAFNPQFLFISAAVNNDNLVTALNSLTLWQITAMLSEGRFRTRRSVILALLIALATLSKLSGLVMVVIGALAGLSVAYRSRDLRGLLILGGTMITAWALLAGWWYARNLILYGELFGTERMLDIFGRRAEPLTLAGLFGELSSLPISYWGLFGWFSIPMPALYQWLITFLLILATIGLILRPPRSIAFGFLSLALALGFLSLIAWTSQTMGTQGRLLFPYLSAISLLLVWGLHRLRIPLRAVIIGLMIAAFYAPIAVIAPEYRPPAPIATLPTSAQPLSIRFDQDHQLLGYEVLQTRYQPGDWVEVTLYWQPHQPTTTNASLFVHLVNRNGEIIGRTDTYPLMGRHTTRTWTPGMIYRDVIPVQITDTTISDLNINVGWWYRDWGYYLTPYDASDHPLVTVSFPAGGVASAGYQAPDNGMIPLDPVVFGDRIALVGYGWEGQVLRLWWERRQPIERDLTVQVVVTAGPIREGVMIHAQADTPPSLSTRWWQAGERYLTVHPLTMPIRGRFPVYLAWYDPINPYRLEIAPPINAYLLAEVDW